MKNKICSVLGSESYLGKHFTKFLQDKNHAVDKYDNIISNDKNINVIDVTKLESLENIDFNVDYLFIFSGLTGTSISFENYRDFINVNEIGLLNILKKYIENKSKAQIIFPSTRLVYKGIENKALNEESSLELKTIYALNKYSCEQYLKLYSDLFSIKYTIFRICVPYGNILSNNLSFGTMGHFFSKAIKKEPLLIYGDGEQKRSFIHIEDLVNIIYLTILNPASINQTYNIGGNEIYSIKEIAEMIAKKYCVNVTHEPWPKLALKIESGDTIFDCKKVEILTNYSYKYNFKDWLNNL